MPFTAQELANITASALDYHVKGKAKWQSVQDRPLYSAMNKSKKTFPGGAGSITMPIKGDVTSGIVGFSHDDQVGYRNPANIKRISFAWYELHAGIAFTLTELKRDGISVSDSMTGKSTSDHSEAEYTRLTGILQDKFDDLDEGWERSMNEIMWRDGTQDSKVFPGIQALIADDPTVGSVGGVSRAANTWWRNRALVSSNKITASAANQTLTKTLRKEVRQLRRYGGRPNLILCGSGFLENLELEVHEKGYYTQTGFANNGKNDIGMAQISMTGVGDFMYDPTLDDLGRTKFAYVLDTRHIKPWVMDGEDMKAHNPARPYDRYVVYRAITSTMALCVDQLNCHGVYEVA